MDQLVRAMRAIAEPTRLRIVVLLRSGELTVGELTQVLGQSQPRVSRHVGLLVEAGIVERLPEGAWVFVRLVVEGSISTLVQNVIHAVPAKDPVIDRDRERLALVSQQRATNAARYFRQSASSWDQIRSLHLDEAEVEAALLTAVGKGPFARMLDIGTGSGRMLEIMADRIGQGLGVDLSHEMLNLSRAKLQPLNHCSVQQADLFFLPVDIGSQDMVTLHQVLHYLADPATALFEAARALKPGGLLALVDFAPHNFEFLREKHAHRRLGFTDQEIQHWMTEAGLVLEQKLALAPTNQTSEKPTLTIKIWIAKRQTS
ncbi:Transcriptional regulator, ArsR family / Methyltransferase fusion [hydrothermal vent metagenome]|uniref:Transcriptional regulator, ArsR family / Methyltransferase fusion n=1 Tax=hydrothermal vent metagenome TaxID=652676 RepID=A0A3B0SLF4_9ZZZZ